MPHGISNDGVTDLVIVSNHSPHGVLVQVYDGATGARLHSFFPFGQSFRGRAEVAVSDLNGDGFTDIIVRARVNGVRRLRAFSGRDLVRLDGFLGPNLLFI